MKQPGTPRLPLDFAMWTYFAVNTKNGHLIFSNDAVSWHNYDGSNA